MGEIKSLSTLYSGVPFWYLHMEEDMEGQVLILVK
jgi:hypothetical protein